MSMERKLEFESRCAVARRVTEETGVLHWCGNCDLNTPSPASTCVNVATEYSEGKYVSWNGMVRFNHSLRRFHDSNHSCSACRSRKRCWKFNAAQIRKSANSRKCMVCQKTCPNKLRELAYAEKLKRYRIERKTLTCTVAEKVGDMKCDYFLQLPCSQLVSCLTRLVESPPKELGPHLLACKKVVPLELLECSLEVFPKSLCVIVQGYLIETPVWVPRCGLYHEYKEAIEKADQLITMPADMCPTQVRLRKPVKRVDTSLTFVRLILCFILKEKLPTKTFRRRGFGSGMDNSVDVDGEPCAGGCRSKVLSCKALPYCSGCNCREMQAALGACAPPKYSPQTNSVVDWARDALFARFSRRQIRKAIGELVLSKFWKETVEFAMKYEMEVQEMREEMLSTMCSICGGPCGIYSYFEATAATVKSDRACCLPWQEAGEEKKVLTTKTTLVREDDGATYNRTNASFSLGGGAAPASVFDFNGAAAEQIAKAERKKVDIGENLDAFQKRFDEEAKRRELLAETEKAAKKAAAKKAKNRRRRQRKKEKKEVERAAAAATEKDNKKAEKVKKCKFFAKGKCHFGDKCRNSHE